MSESGPNTFYPMSQEMIEPQTCAKIHLREVAESDLPILFEHQNDPVAHRTAEFRPRDHESFMAHWVNILADGAVLKRTIMFEGNVAGNIVCFIESGRPLIGYWLGREFWGRGIATFALTGFLELVPTRPVYAFVAKSNVASMRVLEKCGFRPAEERLATGAATGELVCEFLFVLR